MKTQIMKKNKKFEYKNQLRAYDALITTPNPKSFLVIDYWLNEFIRGKKEDSNWINLVTKLIGLESQVLKIWFNYQKLNPHNLWSQKNLELIILYSDIIDYHHLKLLNVNCK
jgi:hypothetical protein